MECERIPFGKDEQRMFGGEFAPYLSRQLAEQTFRAITSNGNSKPFPDDDPDPASPGSGPAHQKVKAGRGQPPAMLLHIFDVAARTKEQNLISSAP
jgi:hypothetical protein